MACKPACRLCRNLIISQSVTVVAIDGVDTLVIDLPAGTYGDNCKFCIVIAQAIPDTATINMPVAFSIGGVTTTVYPFVRCDCSQVTACAIRTRTRYSTIVSTNAISGVFKSLGGLFCCPSNNLPSLPIVEEAAPAEAQVAEIQTFNTPSTRTGSTMKVTKNSLLKKEETENA